MTRYPEFFKRIYLKHIFLVKLIRIGLHFLFQLALQKKTIQVQFESDTSIVAYQQHDQNIFCMSSLASAF